MLTRSDLIELTKAGRAPCVSIYLPTHRTGPDMRQDPIQLKNLADAVENDLSGAWLRAPEARAFLRPVRDLIGDSQFWRKQSDGLALFLSLDGMRQHRLPIAFEPAALVAGRFYVKPLLPFLTGDGSFFVLAVSQNATRLLQGTRYSVREAEAVELPRSLAEALWMDDPEQQLQFRTDAPPHGGAAGRRPAFFHGQGGGKDTHKDDLLRYFRRVNKALHEYLKNEHAPLVVAAVDYLLPLYEEANTYPHLAPDGIAGNPDDLSGEELHDKAWDIVRPLFEREAAEAAERARALSGAGSPEFCRVVEDVVRAAYQGRVDTLFVARGEERWGRYDPQSDGVEMRGERQTGDEDLLDFAAAATLRNGGTVYAVDQAKVPHAALLAAVLR